MANRDINSTRALLKSGLSRSEIRRRIIAQRRGIPQREAEQQAAREFMQIKFSNINQYKEALSKLPPNVRRRVFDLQQIKKQQEKRISTIEKEIERRKKNIEIFQKKRNKAIQEDDDYRADLLLADIQEAKAEIKGLTEGKKLLEKGEIIDPNKIRSYASSLGDVAESKAISRAERNRMKRELRKQGYVKITKGGSSNIVIGYVKPEDIGIGTKKSYISEKDLEKHGLKIKGGTILKQEYIKTGDINKDIIGGFKSSSKISSGGYYQNRITGEVVSAIEKPGSDWRRVKINEAGKVQPVSWKESFEKGYEHIPQPTIQERIKSIEEIRGKKVPITETVVVDQTKGLFEKGRIRKATEEERKQLEEYKKALTLKTATGERPGFFRRNIVQPLSIAYERTRPEKEIISGKYLDIAEKGYVNLRTLHLKSITGGKGRVYEAAKSQAEFEASVIRGYIPTTRGDFQKLVALYGIGAAITGGYELVAPAIKAGAKAIGIGSKAIKAGKISAGAIIGGTYAIGTAYEISEAPTIEEKGRVIGKELRELTALSLGAKTPYLREKAKIRALEEVKPEVTLGVQKIKDDVSNLNIVSLRKSNGAKLTTIQRFEIRQLGDKEFQITGGRAIQKLELERKILPSKKEYRAFTFYGEAEQTKARKLRKVAEDIIIEKGFKKGDIPLISDIKLLEAEPVGKGFVKRFMSKDERLLLEPKGEQFESVGGGIFRQKTVELKSKISDNLYSVEKGELVLGFGGVAEEGRKAKELRINLNKKFIEEGEKIKSIFIEPEEVSFIKVKREPSKIRGIVKEVKRRPKTTEEIIDLEKGGTLRVIKTDTKDTGVGAVVSGQIEKELLSKAKPTTRSVITTTELASITSIKGVTPKSRLNKVKEVRKEVIEVTDIPSVMPQEIGKEAAKTRLSLTTLQAQTEVTKMKTINKQRAVQKEKQKEEQRMIQSQREVFAMEEQMQRKLVNITSTALPKSPTIPRIPRLPRKQQKPPLFNIQFKGRVIARRKITKKEILEPVIFPVGFTARNLGLTQRVTERELYRQAISPGRAIGIRAIPQFEIEPTKKRKRVERRENVLSLMN